jgi:hypothetical protein
VNCWDCCQVLQRAADTRATVVLAAAREELQRRAERINEKALLDSFLRIPEHAAIVNA